MAISGGDNDTATTTVLETLVCSRCDQPRPLADFDARFIGKRTRINCAACRRQIVEQQAAAREAWMDKYDPEWREHARLEAERREWQRAREQHCREILAGGFSMNEVRSITYAEGYLERSGRTWEEVRADHFALDPPYRVPADQRGRRRWLSLEVRERIYEQQGGHCYLYGCELLPLPIWSGSRPTIGSEERIRRRRSHSDLLIMDPKERHLDADPGLPQLDHRIPLVRGGTGELENLAYACRPCNQRKGVMTEAEFRLYPDDPISRLGLPIVWIELMLRMEERGYDWTAHRPRPQEGEGATSDERRS